MSLGGPEGDDLAFRVLVITDSILFYSDMEAAFEPLSLSLLRESCALLALAQQDLLTYLTIEKVNIVVYAGFSPEFEAARLQGLIWACATNSIPVISLSSYRVFGFHQLTESQPSKIIETVIPEPTDPLGQLLLEAESIVLGQARSSVGSYTDDTHLNHVDLNAVDANSIELNHARPNNIVVRIPWSLMSCSQAPEDEGLLDRTCKALLGGSELFVSEEVSGFVIAWSEVARVITAMIQQLLCGADSWGIFHLRSSDSCSEAEFADAVARLLKAEGFNVTSLVATKGTGRLMQSSALLGGRRSTDDFGVQQRSFRIGLKAALRRWIKLNGYRLTITSDASSS